jgi:hypothetical protein
MATSEGQARGVSNEECLRARKNEHLSSVMIPADQVGRLAIWTPDIDDFTRAIGPAHLTGCNDQSITHLCKHRSTAFLLD